MTTSRSHVRTRLALGAAVAGALVLVGAPAWAHVEPDPASVPAGSTQTISFGVEHGCEDAPTTKIEIKVPVGVTEVVPDDDAGPSGWTGAVEGDVVAFEGPAQPSHDGFDVAFSATFPGSEGQAVSFPLVQTCEDGSSIDWIEPLVAGGEEPEHPAPTVTLTAAAQSPASTTEPAQASTTTAVAAETTAATTATTVATTTADDGASMDEAGDDADSGEDDGGSSDTGLLVGGAIVAVLVLGGGAAYLLRRQGGAGGPETPDGTA